MKTIHLVTFNRKDSELADLTAKYLNETISSCTSYPAFVTKAIEDNFVYVAVTVPDDAIVKDLRNTAVDFRAGMRAILSYQKLMKESAE